MIVQRCPVCTQPISLTEWRTLPLVGRRRFTDDTPLLEYRNHTCHDPPTTLVVEVHETAPAVHTAMRVGGFWYIPAAGDINV